jgi:formylmethanofuran dehydrogenase subunit E
MKEIELWEQCVRFHGHSCGELTASNWIRIQNGKKLCVDCCRSYDRFHV